MSRRAKGTYTLIENRAAAYIKQTRDASSSVLMALVERSNYSHKAPMTIAEIMVDTGLMQRAVEKALLRLEALGLASKSAKCWTFPVTNSEASQSANEAASGHTPQVTNEGASASANEGASQDANGNAYQKAYDGTQNSGENIDQHDKGDSLKEVEGSKKEIKDKNTPLTPQGVNGPDGQEKTEPVNPLAADLRPAQDSLPAPQEPSPAKGLEEVPRRAAPPALPADLAAVPGMPEAWGRWQKHAREIRLQLKESTAEAQFRKLRALLDEGKDLPQHIDHAIESGWRSFFPIRQHAAAPVPPAPTDDFAPRRSYE